MHYRHNLLFFKATFSLVKTDWSAMFDATLNLVTCRITVIFGTSKKNY